MVELNDALKGWLAKGWLADQMSRIEQMCQGGASHEDKERNVEDLMEMSQQFLNLARSFVSMSKTAVNAAEALSGEIASDVDSPANEG